MDDYVSKNEQDLNEELFKCEVTFESQSSRLEADLREMKIKFQNLRTTHDKNVKMVAQLCRENGVDINAVKIK